MPLITYDSEQFLKDAQVYVDLSPVLKELEDIRTLKIWEVVTSWKAIKALTVEDLKGYLPHLARLVSAACSAVELAKVAIVAEADPDGSRGAWFAGRVQLETAAKIIFGNIKFGDWLGWVPQRVWRSLIYAMITTFVMQMPINWGSLAVDILKLVVLG